MRNPTEKSPANKERPDRLKQVVTRMAALALTITLATSLAGCKELDTRSASEREQDRLEELSDNYIEQHPEDIVIRAGRNIRDADPDFDFTQGTGVDTGDILGKLNEPLSVDLDDIEISQIEQWNDNPYWYEITGETKGRILADENVDEPKENKGVFINGINLNIPEEVNDELVQDYKKSKEK